MTTEGKNIEEEISLIAEMIERYLIDKRSADTLKGLLQWWVTRQKIIEEEAKVKKAIKLLVAKGKLQRRKNADGTEIYYVD